MKFRFIERISDSLVENGTIREDEKELYTYGLEQGCILILNTATTILIGLLFGMFWQSVIFMIAYVPLRIFAGGFHAPTQIQCYLTSAVMIAASLLVIKLIPWTSSICYFITLISAVLVIILSPVEDSNKPLDSVEISVYKKRARIILLLEMIAVLALIFTKVYVMAYTVSVALATLSLMLVLGWCSNRAKKIRASQSIGQEVARK